MQMPIEWMPAQGAPQQLILLLHGWAQNAEDLAPLAQALRQAFPQAAVIAPQSPLAADGGRRGGQWYSIEGITSDAEWRRRVHDTLPGIEAWVRQQQQRLGVSPAATALGGFSQGGLLALHTVMQHDGLAGRVLAFCARVVDLPEVAPQLSTLHLFHGDADKIFGVDQARALLERVAALNGDATLDVAQGLGHELHPALIDCALHQLRSHIPLRTWREAMGGAPAHARAPDDE